MLSKIVYYYVNPDSKINIMFQNYPTMKKLAILSLSRELGLLADNNQKG